MTTLITAAKETKFGTDHIEKAVFGLQYNTIRTLLTAPHRGFSGPMKQSTKQQNTTTTTVKNPNWPEANQLAIYKCSWEVEPGTTRNKFNEWSERVLDPGSPDRKASALTTGPHCLLICDFSIDFLENCWRDEAQNRRRDREKTHLSRSVVIQVRFSVFLR